MARFLRDGSTRAITPAFRKACLEELKHKDAFERIRENSDLVFDGLDEEEIEEILDSLKLFGIIDGASFGRALGMSEKTGQRLYPNIQKVTFEKFERLRSYCYEDIKATEDKKLFNEKIDVLRSLEDIALMPANQIEAAAMDELAYRCLIDGYSLLKSAHDYDERESAYAAAESCRTLLRVLRSLLAETYGTYDEIYASILELEDCHYEDEEEYRTVVSETKTILATIDTLLYEDRPHRVMRDLYYLIEGGEARVKQGLFYKEVFKEYLEPYED